ncbi:MAG: hypothetical protein KAH01_00365, partial [Caldisericia bacterium]|nr:hypothetical protein [Caldisericia bacterium]
DPITLIDPSGNSPENTGNPPRMSGPNAHISSNPIRIPDITQPGGPNPIDNVGGVAIGAVAGVGVGLGNITANYDACGSYGYTDITSQLTDAEKEIGFVHKYQVIINGIAVTVYETKNGSLFASPKTGGFFSQDGSISKESTAIAIGLNLAFGKLRKDGVSLGDTKTFLRNLVLFARDNLGTFMNIVGGGTDGLTQFMKHATIGYGVSLLMHTYDNDPLDDGVWTDYSLYDYEIAFWTSFWYDEFEMDGATTPEKNTHDSLSILEVANLLKASAYQESRLGQSKQDWENADDNNDRGVFQIDESPYKKEGGWNWPLLSLHKNLDGVRQYGSNFIGTNYLNNRFLDIGLGIGITFGWLVLGPNFTYSTGDRTATYSDWLDAIRGFNAGLVENWKDNEDLENHMSIIKRVYENKGP